MTDVRELYDRVLKDREARGETSDVPVEDIVAVVERTGSEEHRAAILNRLLATAEGRRELDLVRAAARASAPSRSLNFRIPLAIAATLAIALIGRFALRDDPGRDVLRGDPSAPRAIALLAPAEDITTADSTRFTWTPIADATSYQIEVLDDAGRIAWTQTLTDSSTVLPREVSLVPGRTYRWRVVARTETGDVASPTRLLRVGR